MVDHLTRVTVDRAAPRAGELAVALARLGFTVQEDASRIVADSRAVEARQVKERLRSLGISDREYRIRVEFFRRWGVM